MRATLFGLALLVVFSIPPALADDVDEEEQKFLNSVNKAIDRGLLWVVSQQRDNGSWPGHEKYLMGMTSIGWLTILACDYPPKADASRKAKKFLKERFDKQHPTSLGTCEVGILMMALGEQHALLRRRKPAKKSRYANVPEVRKVRLPPRTTSGWRSARSGWRTPRRGRSGAIPAAGSTCRTRSTRCSAWRRRGGAGCR